MPWCTTCNLAKSVAPGFKLITVAHVDLSGNPCVDRRRSDSAPYHVTDEEDRNLNFVQLMAEIGDWP